MSLSARVDPSAPRVDPESIGRVVLAVAVSPGRLAAGLVGEHGETIVRDRVTTPSHEVWRTLEGLIRRVIAAAPDNLPRPTAVGVSCTGPVDTRAGAVSPHSVRTWTSFPLREHLETMTGLPVHLDSAAAARAEGERWVGSARDYDDFVMLLVDETVESACVQGGALLQGAHGNAGSIAHVLTDPEGLTCWCGARGCLSPYASAVALEAELNRPLRRATSSIVERTGIMLGRALGSLLALVDVPRVLFAGSVVDVFGDPLVHVIERELGHRDRARGLGQVDLVEVTGSVDRLIAAASLTHRPLDA